MSFMEEFLGWIASAFVLSTVPLVLMVAVYCVFRWLKGFRFSSRVNQRLSRVRDPKIRQFVVSALELSGAGGDLTFQQLEQYAQVLKKL